MQFILPLKKWEIGGYRFGELTFYNTKHKGIDLKANQDLVFACQDGESIKKWGLQGGNWLYLNCENEIQFRFAHLAEYKKLGQVKKGEIIAISGNTGLLTTKPHLHFEVLVNKEYVNPEQFMFKNILVNNFILKPLLEENFKAVEDWFAQYNIFIKFWLNDPLNIKFWAKLVVRNTGSSWTDTFNLYKTKDWYDIAFSWQDVYNKRKPEDILIHEILHALYQDAFLPDIHEFGWGVADNTQVVQYLIEHQNNYMQWIILPNKEQYLIYEPMKIAFNIADEQELEKLKTDHNLQGAPLPKNNLNGYAIYPMVEKKRLQDLFGF